MPVLLDTDVAIALIRGNPPSARERYREAAGDGEDIWVSSVSLFELWYGVSNSRDVHANTERLLDFLGGPLSIAGFTEQDAARAGLIRAQLATAGTPIGPYDLLIAAHAARNGYTLATANVREFGRVEGLTVANWMDAGG